MKQLMFIALALLVVACEDNVLTKPRNCFFGFLNVIFAYTYTKCIVYTYITGCYTQISIH